MKQNILELLQAVRKRVRAGFPNGVDAESHRQIPFLINRVEELESALAPFARIAKAESTVRHDNPNHLVNCRLTDCVTARKLIDPEFHPATPAEQPGIFIAE